MAWQHILYRYVDLIAGMLKSLNIPAIRSCIILQDDCHVLCDSACPCFSIDTGAEILELKFSRVLVMLCASLHMQFYNIMSKFCNPIFFNFHCKEVLIISGVITHYAISSFTDITNPKIPPGSKEATKSFNYDYSYWSHNVSCFCKLFL
jgi:hypothetical protein